MTWNLGLFRQRSVHDYLDQQFRFQKQKRDCMGFWTIGVAVVMVSPLLMVFKLFASVLLMGSAVMAILAWHVRFMGLWGLVALSCVWIWLLESLLPTHVMIDSRAQRGNL